MEQQTTIQTAGMNIGADMLVLVPYVNAGTI